MSEVSDESSKYFLSGAIGVASFLAARVFDRFDKSSGRVDEAIRKLETTVAVLESRIKSLEYQLKALLRSHDDDES